MISSRKLKANRSNAQASTGPRTPTGKACAARNARKHGLSVPIMANPSLAADVKILAKQIAGEGASDQLEQLAARIAEVARLAAIDRYERRALSRRKFAIRAFDAARRQLDTRVRRDHG